jgi:hypothetical protein
MDSSQRLPKLSGAKNNFNIMKKLSFVLVLVIAAILMQSCQKEDAFDPFEGQAAPELPAEETFVMSMTPFLELDNFKNPGTVDDRSIDNWGHAAANVVVWNTLLTVHLTIPTLSFYESFRHQPEYQGQGVWRWKYEVSDQTGTYRAELFGKLLVNDEVQWDMYISKVGGFSQVHWYSGVVANDHSYANWTLNFNANNPTPFISIDYERDNGNGVASIRYTNIISGTAGNGGYIEYRVGNVVPGVFDRAYDVYNAEEDNLLEINWDSLNKNGRVKDAKKFQDDDWHCWDVSIQDVNC